LEHRELVLALGGDQRPGGAQPEPRIGRESLPDLRGGIREAACHTGLCADAEMAEVADRGPDGGGGAVQDDDAESPTDAGVGGTEPDDARADHDEVRGVRSGVDLHDGLLMRTNDSGSTFAPVQAGFRSFPEEFALRSPGFLRATPAVNGG